MGSQKKAVIAALVLCLCLGFSGCGKTKASDPLQENTAQLEIQPENPSPSPAELPGDEHSQEESVFVPLTDEELAGLNTRLGLSDPLSDEAGLNPLCLFFTSLYQEPTQLELGAFLRYFPSDGSGGEAEFEALRRYEDWPFRRLQSLADMPVPLSRIDAASVENVLEKYAGIGLDELKNKSEGVYYLEEYKAFYVYTSDFGLESFVCSYGERQGDILRLYKEHWDGSTRILTVREDDEGLKVLAHQAKEAE